MHRVTVTLDDELMTAIDHIMTTRGYQNRSEAIRDLARAGIARLQEETPAERDGVAALVYVYDHEERELAKRLTRSSHQRHDLSLATMHIHLDHDSCMEIAVLRGRLPEIRTFADHVVSERGVRHGRLITIPAELEEEQHPHGQTPGHKHQHAHVREAG